MKTQVQNDTEFSGEYTLEGNKLVATISAGKQKSDDLKTKKKVFHCQDIKGTAEFIQDGEMLKVTAVELKPENLDRKGDILAVNYVFKKSK